MEYREFRAQSVSSDEGVIEGLVTPFDAETVIGDLKHGGFREKIAPGAFRKTLREGDPVMVYQHNMAMPLARVSAGNLALREGTYEGQKGLVVRAEPVDTSYAQDMRKLVEADVLGGFSFGFRVTKDEWTDDKGNPSTPWEGTNRTIREVQLVEVSPVTNPAYPQTVISARSAVDEARGIDEERGPKPYGDVKYADPKNGKYPIDTKEHVKAAWSYINMPKNAANYPLNGVSLSSVKSKIKAAAAKFGIEISDGKSDVDPEEQRDEYEDEFYERGEETSGSEEDRDQEPGTSTPEDDDGADFALWLASREADHRAAELGYV